MRSTKPMPFGFNPKVEHRNARLRRLIRKGTLKPMTKAQARREAEKALTEIARLIGVPEAAKAYIKHSNAARRALALAKALAKAEAQNTSSLRHER